MKKEQKLIDALYELLKEQAEIESQISALPVGYISVKVISGKPYNYRQWREGNKIISEYVKEGSLNSVKRKIAARKEYEALLKEVKKEIKSVTRKVLKAESMSEEEIEALREKAAAEIE